MNFIMGDQNNRDIAQLLDPADGFQDFHLLFLAKGRGRLIQDQNFGTEINRPRNRQSLALAT